MLAMTWEGGTMQIAVRRTREDMQAIRDRLLLDLAAGRRVSVAAWAREHGVSWQRAYAWLREIECGGVLAVVALRDGAYVKLGCAKDEEIAD